VQWKDTWVGRAEDEIREVFHKRGRKIKTVALGYGNSYVISFGNEWGLGGMRYKFNLNSHSKDLDKFAKDNKSMQIVARELSESFPYTSTDITIGHRIRSQEYDGLYSNLDKVLWIWI
jgi:hypothetical protein